MNPDPVAGWYPDPAARAEYRYWDGIQWSPWISTRGVAQVDPQMLEPGVPAPPAIAPPPPPPPAPAPVGGYGRPSSLSLRGLSVALTWLMGAAVLACLARIATVINALVKLDRFDEFSTFERYDAWSDAHDAANTAAGWTVIVAIAIFVVFVVFMFRASKNTALWATDRARWAPGWTIGGWFIPLAWFVIPCMVMCEIWVRSTPREEKPSSARVVWWWLAFVVGLVASSGFSPDTVAEYRIEYTANLVGAVLLVVAAGMFVWIVRELDRRQVALSGRAVPTYTA